jgi:hypothetical protein
MPADAYRKPSATDGLELPKPTRCSRAKRDELTLTNNKWLEQDQKT